MGERFLEFFRSVSEWEGSWALTVLFWLWVIYFLIKGIQKMTEIK